jgi:hypothetical protein
MIAYTNTYTQKIYMLLIPLVGDYIARNLIKTQALKLGLTEEKIAKKDLPTLAEGIRKGLLAFLGSEKAGQIAIKITAIS